MWKLLRFCKARRKERSKMKHLAKKKVGDKRQGCQAQQDLVPKSSTLLNGAQCGSVGLSK